MYLVVTGYCRTVFESTLTLEKPKRLPPKLCNSKEIYGEIGVIKNHLKSANPDFVVKNVRAELRPVLKKLKTGFLPPI